MIEAERKDLKGKLFHVCMFMYGFDTRKPHTRTDTVKNLQSIQRILLILYAVFRILLVCHMLKTRKTLMSCGELAVILNHLLSIRVAFGVLESYKNAKLHELARKHLDNEKSFFLNILLVLLGLLFYTALTFVRRLNSVEFFLRLLCLPIYITLFAFLVLYKQLVTKLCQVQQDILAQVTECDQVNYRFEELRVQKVDMRHTIQEINQHCGSNLTILCIKTFLGIAFAAESAFHRSIDYAYLVNSIAIQTFYLILMTRICSRGSELLTLIDYTERILCRRQPTVRAEEVNALRKFLEFDEKWDSLLMTGGFSVGIPAMISFFTTCFTITAIIMQFDYKTIARLQGVMEAHYIPKKDNT